METSLKTGFAQVFSCCPKNLSCPNFGGTAAPLAPPAHTPMPRTYQCPQVSVYFEIATFLQLINVLWIVILALLCIFICCAFAEGSYQESKPGNEKHKAR